MKIHRLAPVFELKYGLKSLAASTKETLNQVKKDLVNAYTLYVSQRSKEPVLQILANIKEPFSKKLVSSMEEMVANIDNLSASDLFQQVNDMLSHIHLMKEDKGSKVRNFIHDSVRVTKESEKNYREHIKSKFEVIVSRLSSILAKQAKALQTLSGLGNTPLSGGAVEPQRKELSKDKILMFMRTPAAQSYGLDSLEIMARVLSYPDLKEKITTIINAVDRGHTPIDGPEVKAAAAEIMKVFNERQQTNLPALEQAPEKPAPPVSLLGYEEQEATL
jgi:enoyl reductase-like protein